MEVEYIVKLLMNVIVGILLPLLFGYSFNVPTTWTVVVGKCTHWTVLILIFVMGLIFGVEPGISDMLAKIGFNAVIFFFILSFFNFIALGVLYSHTKRTEPNILIIQAESVSVPRQIWGRICKASTELEIIFALMIGYLIGSSMLITPTFDSEYLDLISYALLGLMLFFIGLELRMQKIKLLKSLLNRQGAIIAMVVALSSWLAALPIYWLSRIMDTNDFVSSTVAIDWRESLAITSGFGWSSISGIIVTQKSGPYLGGIVFIIDMARELFIIICLPLLSKIDSRIGTGYSGATAMDVSC